MRTKIFVTAGILAIMVAGAVFADSLDQTAAPTDPATAMYTLEDIYQRLATGAAGTKRVGPFREPTAGPGSTGHTLDEVMGLAPAIDAGGAMPADVLNGKTFWGLTGGAWGLQTGKYTCPPTATGNAATGDVLSGKTFSNLSANGITGTMTDNGAVAITPGTTAQTIPAGYHNGTGTVAGDANLVSGNIRGGTSIFGVSGGSKIMDTTAGTAAAGDILSGKTAFVNGAAVTGSVTAGSNFSGANGSLSMTIPDGLYSASKTATASDSNLTSANIKSGTTIFGVAGTSVQASGAATDTQVLSGVTYSNSGGASTGTMTNNGAVTITPGTTAQTIPVGYHNGTGTVAGDANLVSGNIKSGTTIFGIPGDTNVVNTSTGTAAAGDIASGKTAYVGGSKITGTAYIRPCTGTLSSGGRWCDQGNGTVMDRYSGLVWLKDAMCKETLAGISNSTGSLNWNDAMTWVTGLQSWVCGLSDGSVAYEWRLPTKRELIEVTTGTEGIVDGFYSGHFTNVASGFYWSANTRPSDPTQAYDVILDGSSDPSGYKSKTSTDYVWAVR